MVFSSGVFLLLYLPLVLALYYAVPGRLRNGILLLASLVFYAWGEPIYVLIMLFSTVFDYGNGLLLDCFDRQGRQKARKAVLVLSVAVNIGLLCFFKYTDFAIDTLHELWGVGIAPLRLALPIGISFYTFQTLSYTIDVYRRRVPAQRNIIAFGMYISMFPQLIAGPIVRYTDVQEQLFSRRIDSDAVCRGIGRFVLGLSKKVLLANPIGELWAEISAVGTVPAATAWLGAAAFTLQIYFDFSGYSDMAIGLGQMLGFTLPENFRHPYEAKSITEFWRRWHITLGTWFREYLYIPLGGNRCPVPRQLGNLLAVWFLTGLWHGAGWNFILWGLYFFIFLTLEKFFLRSRASAVPAALRHIYTMAVVLFSWVIFACDDMALLGSYVRSFWGANGLCNGMSLYYFCANAPLLLIGVLLSTSLVGKWCRSLWARLSGERLRFAVAAVLCGALYVLCVACVACQSYNPFLYFRF